jgi:hypothetical protein
MDSITDLLYKLIKDNGVTILYFVLYVGSIIYLMILRNREMTKLVLTINELVNAFDNLRTSVDSHMRQTTLIMTATISALNGDKKAAKNMVATMDTIEKNERQDNRRESDVK